MCLLSFIEQGKIKLFKTEVNYVEIPSNGINKLLPKLNYFVVPN